MKEKKVGDGSTKKCKLLVWITEFIILILVAYVYKKYVWVWDAFDYWNRGENLKNEMFDISNIDGFRGYIYILFLGFTNLVGGKSAWIVINAMLISFCQTFFIYSVGTDLEYNKKDFVRILCANWITIILFWGLFGYPLSDLFALMCCCCSAYYIRKSIECHDKCCYLYLILGGVFGYWAYNTRTIYLFAGIALFILYQIMSFYEERVSIIKLLVIEARSLLFIFGCVVASIPQMIMNYDNEGKISMGVPTDGLMLQQMSWGIKVQRYDTYLFMDISDGHPTPCVFFLDPSGTKMLSELQIEQFETWGDYFGMFIAHPIDMIILYFRHGINFLFPCWPQTYITDLNTSKVAFGVLGGTIVFLTILVFLEKCIKNYKSIVYYIPLIVTGLAIIPGAVEYRFSLPLYVFAISQLCFNVDYGKLRDKTIQCKYKIVFCYLLFMLMCFSIWSNTLANEAVAPLLF